MAINFPTSLDTLTNPTGSNTLNSPDHATQHANANDAVEALEAKVGVDGSAVTTSHDYKLSGVTGTDKAASKTGSETLTNKTLGAGTSVSLGSDGTGDVYYRNSGGALTRLPIGTAGQILDVSAGGLPEWVTNPAAADASTTVKGVVEVATQAEADAGTASGGTTAPLVTRTSNIRARNYNDYVVDTGSANAYAIAPTPAITAYADGQIFVFKAINANTTASTLAVNGLTAKAIRKAYNVALVSGDILAGQRVLVIYDAANDFFQMLNPPAAITASASGATATSSISTSTNTDTTITVPFTARTIELVINPSTLGDAGQALITAVFNSTTLQYWFGLYDQNSALTLADFSYSTGALTLAGTGGNNWSFTITITSITSTGFTVRVASTKTSAPSAATINIGWKAFA